MSLSDTPRNDFVVMTKTKDELPAAIANKEIIAELGMKLSG